MRYPRVAIASLGLAIVAAGCASSPARPAVGSSGQPTPSPDTPAATPGLAQGASDEARATAILIHLGDLPIGWKTEANSTTPTQQLQQDTYFDRCLGVPITESETTVMKHAYFQRNDGLAFASTSVDVTKTVGEAAQDNQALMSAKAVSCDLASFHKFFAAPKGGRINSITGNALTVQAGYFGERFVINLTLASGTAFSFYVDNFGFITKRFEVQVEFDSAVQPPQSSLERAASAAVFARENANAD